MTHYACVVLIFFSVISLSNAATIVVDTSEDGLEDCSLRQAIAVINLGGVFLDGDCENSGAPFGQADSIYFKDNISSVYLGETTGDLTIYKDVRINVGGPRVKVDGKLNGRSIFAIVAGAKVHIHNLHITGGQGGEYRRSANGVNVLDSSLTLSDSLVSGNISDSGEAGGIHIRFSKATILNSEISNNFGRDTGGVEIIDSEVEILKSTIAQNTSISIGSGVVSSQSKVDIVNTTISGNQSTRNKIDVSYPGVYVSLGSATITHTTISGNIANPVPQQVPLLPGESPSPAASIGGVDATIVLRNSIVSAEVNQLGCYTTTTVFGVSSVVWDGPSLVQDGSCGASGESDVIRAAPKLDKLRFNGRRYRTQALLVGSPAIDTAGDAVCNSPEVNNRDQRMKMRPIGPACDLGAFEGARRALGIEFMPAIQSLLD